MPTVAGTSRRSRAEPSLAPEDAAADEDGAEPTWKIGEEDHVEDGAGERGLCFCTSRKSSFPSTRVRGGTKK